MGFSALGLSKHLLASVELSGYTTPTPIQEQTIPIILEGRDLLAAAETGSGKTAAYALPLLQRLAKGKSARSNHCRALVLTPTRELAAQVTESLDFYGQTLDLSATAVFGGIKINPQMMRLRPGVDVLVATPGRLLDLYRQNAIRFEDIEMLVLDEADRMFELGFSQEMDKILAILPNRKQTLLFSATFSDDIKALASKRLYRPAEITVGEGNSAARLVDHWLYAVDEKKKQKLLLHILKEENRGQVLIFTGTKQGANQLNGFLLEQGLTSTAIHGDKPQNVRTRELDRFRSGLVRVLVATDLVARGLDIEQLPQVINYNMPKVAQDYIHRIGRTGRAGEPGEALSLVTVDEFDRVVAVEQLLQAFLPRKEVRGFPVLNQLPDSPEIKPLKPKKPKKKKKQGHQDGQRGAQN